MGKSNLLFVIDDDQDFVDTMVELISEEFSCSIKTFNGAFAAVKAIEEGGLWPDLILSDIYMFTGSGLMLTRLLQEKNIDIPVFYVTGMVDNLASSEGLKIFRKPVDWTSLFENMRLFVR